MNELTIHVQGCIRYKTTETSLEAAEDEFLNRLGLYLGHLFSEGILNDDGVEYRSEVLRSSKGDILEETENGE